MSSLWGDVGSVVGGALGTIVAPGVGTAIGAGLGGALGGQIGGADDTNSAPQQNQAQLGLQQLQISNLASSQATNQAATYQEGEIGADAEHAVDEAANTGAFANNAAVRSSVSNNIFLSAERAKTGVATSAAEQNSRNTQSAIEDESRLNSEDWTQRLAQDKINRTPNFWEQTGMNAISSTMGSLSKWMDKNIQSKPDTTTPSTPPTAPDPSVGAPSYPGAQGDNSFVGQNYTN